MNMTLEELNYIYNFNPNHDEKGLFASGSYLTAFESLVKMSNTDILLAENKYDKYWNKNKEGEFVKEKFGGKPRILDSSEKSEKQWNKMSHKKYQEIYRVVEKREYEYDYYDKGSHIGNGRKGSGHYFFSDENKMEEFGRGFEDRRVIIAKINKKELLKEKDLPRLKELYENRAYNSGINNSKIIDNDGALASLLNIKAISYNDGTVLVLDKSATTVLISDKENFLNKIDETLKVFNVNEHHDEKGLFTFAPYKEYPKLEKFAKDASIIGKRFFKLKQQLDNEFYGSESYEKTKNNLDKAQSDLMAIKNRAYKEHRFTQEQILNFNKELEDWTTGLGPRDKKGNLISLPELLKNKDNPINKFDIAYTQAFYYELGGRKANKEITLFRGQDFEKLPKGYTSMTTRKAIASNFGKIFEIKVPISKIIADGVFHNSFKKHSEEEIIVNL